MIPGFSLSGENSRLCREQATLCDEKGIEIIRAEDCPAYVHMGFLKGKSSLMNFDRQAKLNKNMGIDCFGRGSIIRQGQPK